MQNPTDWYKSIYVPFWKIRVMGPREPLPREQAETSVLWLTYGGGHLLPAFRFCPNNNSQ